MNDDSRQTIEATLEQLVRGNGNPLDAVVALVDAIRPARPTDGVTAIRNFRTLRELMAGNPAYRAAMRQCALALLQDRRQVSFFAGSGMLPATGFFSELWRRIVNRVLPEVPHTTYLRDVMAVIFHRHTDHLWLSALPVEDSRELWGLFDMQEAAGHPAIANTMNEIVRAAVVVSQRVAAMGLEREFVKADPLLEETDWPFVAQNAAMHRYAESLRESLANPSAPRPDSTALRSLVGECRAALLRASETAMMRGTSLDLSYLFARLGQHIDRLDVLIRLIEARHSDSPRQAMLQAWVSFIREAIRGENERNSIRTHVSRLTQMLAVRVTQNAGRTGEHYITSDRAGYFSMMRSAGGAGIIIGLMALLKIYASKLGLPPLPAALVYSLNYALGFMLVHVLHFTIATKQPAMTASAIAAAMTQENGHLRDPDGLARLVINTVRSQFAAICGNVFIAFPVALTIGVALNLAIGAPFIPEEKTAHLLLDIDPFAGPALLHAAIAGLWLFIAGLISGYFDNAAAYYHVPDRVAGLRWMNRLLGPERCRRIGDYLDGNLGPLMSNFFFGFMLGCTALIGLLLGMNIDIRHVAFGSANFAYGIAGSGFALAPSILLTCAFGVAMIGIVNLCVSFALALWLAARAQGVRFPEGPAMLKALFRSIAARPLSLVWPPRNAGDRTMPDGIATRHPDH